MEFRRHYQFTIVVGESMLPTLRSGATLVVDRLAYVSRPPQRGDIVMASYGPGFIVKRIVGLPGEEVEVKQRTLYVDGVAQKENHTVEPGRLDVGKGKLLEGDFATLGDNRAIPDAVAVHPVLSKSEILGKVVMTLNGFHLGVNASGPY
jgi:signal peptidase I